MSRAINVIRNTQRIIESVKLNEEEFDPTLETGYAGPPPKRVPQPRAPRTEYRLPTPKEVAKYIATTYTNNDEFSRRVYDGLLYTKEGNVYWSFNVWEGLLGGCARKHSKEYLQLYYDFQKVAREEIRNQSSKLSNSLIKLATKIIDELGGQERIENKLRLSYINELSEEAEDYMSRYLHKDKEKLFYCVKEIINNNTNPKFNLTLQQLREFSVAHAMECISNFESNYDEHISARYRTSIPTSYYKFDFNYEFPDSVINVSGVTCSKSHGVYAI